MCCPLDRDEHDSVERGVPLRYGTSYPQRSRQGSDVNGRLLTTPLLYCHLDICRQWLKWFERGAGSLFSRRGETHDRGGGRVQIENFSSTRVAQGRRV